MSLLCRLGFHDLFGDTILTNLGTDKLPVLIGVTYETCNRCGWTTRPKPHESHKTAPLAPEQTAPGDEGHRDTRGRENGEEEA